MDSKILGLIIGGFLTVLGFLAQNGYILIFGLFVIVVSLVYSNDVNQTLVKNSMEKDLLKNKELYDKGILTEDEYTERQKKIKNKLNY